jgi:hypothetical protein
MGEKRVDGDIYKWAVKEEGLWKGCDRLCKLDLDCGSVARLYRLGSNNIRPVGNLK